MWLALLISLAAQAVLGEIFTEKVFGPETATGPYKHPASFTELDNGDLFLVYYGGGGEYAGGTAVFGARKAKGSQRWSAPRKLASDPFRPLGNGVIWQAPDKVLWLFYVVRFGETWSSSRIQVKISSDRGETWSDPSLLALEAGMMVRGRPIVLKDGRYLLPVFHETGEDREIVGPESTSRFLLFDPSSQKWTTGGIIRSTKGNIQPAPVQLSDGRIIAYCRRGGGYGPVTDGYLVRAESTNGGMTWTEGVDSQFPNPNSAVDFIRLRNGHLLLVYNHSMHRRTPLRAAISTDDDRTWPIYRDIGTGDRDYAYPVALQAQDGRIHVIYTTSGRKQIMHQAFSESDISGQPVGQRVQ